MEKMCAVQNIWMPCSLLTLRASQKSHLAKSKIVKYNINFFYF